MTKARDVAYEIIGDHEKTIKNFRDYAKRLQEENHDLRASLEKETNKPISTPAETLMFKVLIHAAYPKPSPVVITIFTRVIRTSLCTPQIQHLAKQNKLK